MKKSLIITICFLVLTGCNSEQTVQKINEYYEKDAQNVYFIEDIEGTKNRIILEGADPASFQAINIPNNNELVIAKDKKYVYFGKKLIDYMDGATFQNVALSVFKDKNSVYLLDKIVPLDPNTIEFVPDNDNSLTTSYFKDKNNVYNCFNSCDLLSEVDPKIFVISGKTEVEIIKNIVENYIKNSVQYKNVGGTHLEKIKTTPLSCAGCYDFEYEFRLQSKKDGSFYGVNDVKVEVRNGAITKSDFKADVAGCPIEKDLCVNDNKIYAYGMEKGYLEDGKINIFLEDKVIASFKGDTNKLSFFQMSNAENYNWNFYYDNLDISTKVQWPYEIYKPVTSVEYKCDGSLVKDGNSNKDVPNFYCETNNTDFLSQYEFSATTGVGFATGGDFNMNWHKIYIRKINDQNVFFFVGLKGKSLNSNENTKEDQELVPTKKYLDEILKDPGNIESIKKADEFVKNVEIKLL